jgi:hypothetical protein
MASTHAASAHVARLLDQHGGSCSRGCTTIDKLHWWGMQLGDDGCRALSEQIIARRLNLSNLLLGHSSVGDECIAAISGVASRGSFGNLKSLGLSRNAKLTDVGCETLAEAFASGHFPRLKELYLSNNDMLGDRCAVALARAFAQPRGPQALEHLGLNDLHAISADGLLSLLAPLSLSAGGGPRLREISLRNMSRVCVRSHLPRLVRALEALARVERSDSHGAPPAALATLAAVPGMRDPVGRRRRRVHVVLRGSPACREASRDPLWLAASARWSGSATLEHGAAGPGEVRVSVGRRI